MEAINGSSSQFMTNAPLLSNNNGAIENSPPPEYLECMKNHAANRGTHVVDGCGEFMALRNSLTCAACGCHRNFHRRVPDPFTPAISPLPLNSRRPLPPFQSGPSTNLTVNTSVTEQDHRQAPVMPSTENPAVRRKRFRRKFTKVQKERMHSFSEKAGWKMQGCNKTEVEELCKEIGITRSVIRVWMYNNKKAVGKRGSVMNGDASIINGSTSSSTP